MMVCILTEPIMESKHDCMYSYLNQLCTENMMVCILTEPITWRKHGGMYYNWTNYIHQTWWYIF